MTFENGIYLSDTQEQILDAMVADAKEYFGEDLKDDDLAIIRLFYAPIAVQFSNVQDDIGLVLQSAQIDYAQDRQLDLLTALIGVTRESATIADGEVTFSRSDAASKDYTIPSGTIVQTDSNEPTKYETAETAVLSQGNTSVIVPVESIEAGVKYNTGPNTVTILSSPPAGVESVTNIAEINGGSEAEQDNELRQRAKDELAEGSRASAPALINSVYSLDGVTSTSIFINDSQNDNTGTGGLPSHSFEIVANGGNKQEIGQAIMNTKAAGDTSYAGVNGSAVTVTTTLPNNQTKDVQFSRPSSIQIYIEGDLDVTDEYAGNDEVIANVVEYIGGLLPSGNEDGGDLQVGDDVVHGEVEFAIRAVEGVYDVNSLTIGKTASPTGTSNLTISNSEIATSDGTDSSMNLTTTTVSQ